VEESVWFEQVCSSPGTSRPDSSFFSLPKSMSEDLKDAISENAKGPAKAAGDAGSVEQHKLSEQIEADKYLASKEAAKSKRRGLQFNKLVPPGAN
jgi:hypothetical protein